MNQEIIKNLSNNLKISEKQVEKAKEDIKTKTSTNNNNENNKFCKNCGAPLDSDSKFCSSCGKEVQ